MRALSEAPDMRRDASDHRLADAGANAAGDVSPDWSSDTDTDAAANCHSDGGACLQYIAVRVCGLPHRTVGVEVTLRVKRNRVQRNVFGLVDTK